MRPRDSAAIGGCSAVVLVVALIWFTPPTSSFNPSNSGWNGLSDLRGQLSATPLQNYSLLEGLGAGHVLLVVGPTLPFSQVQISAVKGFLSSGGNLVVADDTGSGNALIRGIGLRSTFSGEALSDPGSNLGNPRLPLALTNEANASVIAMDYPTTITLSDNSSKVVAVSTSFSYVAANGGSGPSSRNPVGPFVVAASVPDGKGTVTMVSDSSVFINAMIGKEDNTQFLKDLVAGDGQILLDEAHVQPNTLDAARGAEAIVYGDLAPLYARGILLVGATAVFGIVINRQKKPQDAGQNDDDEVLAVLKEHPTWDEATLRRLEKERQW